MIHGVLAGILSNIGRNILDSTMAEASAPTPGPSAFSSILENKQIEKIDTLQDLLRAKPDINEAELLQIEQNLKSRVVAQSLNLSGDMSPLALGEWDITERVDPVSNQPVYTVSDATGHTLRFRPESSAYQQIGLIKDIQDHIQHSRIQHTFTASSPFATQPTFTVPPFPQA